MDSDDKKSILDAANLIKKNFKPQQIAQLIRLLEPTSPAGEMSAEVFESVFEMLKETHTGRWYSDRSIEAARLVLVMGASISEAAAETEQSRQSVSQLMQRIKKRIEAVPAGWVKFEHWLPPKIAAQLEAITKELKVLPKEQMVNTSIAKLIKE